VKSGAQAERRSCPKCEQEPQERATERAAELGDQRWRELLTRHRRIVRRELAHFRGEEVDTAGDGFFATFDGPARAIECARSIVAASADEGLALRAGLHTGECELADAKVTGLAVHIGARVVDSAGAGEIRVSGTVKDLVAGSELEFEDRGARQLKASPANGGSSRSADAPRRRTVAWASAPE
jgi:class 3 adenylate cyclase